MRWRRAHLASLCIVLAVPRVFYGGDPRFFVERVDATALSSNAISLDFSIFADA